jgi:hypothetical protein
MRILACPRHIASLLIVLSVVVVCAAGCAAEGRQGAPGIHTVVSPIDEGEVPEGTTVFDDDVPAVAHLDPALREALRAASERAADDGEMLRVNSGWRSPALQERLLRDAVGTYGSLEEAARWVATPETSAHVSGDAIDVGPWDGADWLDRHGEAFGLCRIYVNEPWHFELRPDAPTAGCPRMYLDPTEDPRMAG